MRTISFLFALVVVVLASGCDKHHFADDETQQPDTLQPDTTTPEPIIPTFLDTFTFRMGGMRTWHGRVRNEWPGIDTTTYTTENFAIVPVSDSLIAIANDTLPYVGRDSIVMHFSLYAAFGGGLNSQDIYYYYHGDSIKFEYKKTSGLGYSGTTRYLKTP